MSDKKFTFNVNKNTIEKDGEFFCYLNSYNTTIIDKLNEQEERIHDKEELIRAKNKQLDNAKQILKSEMKYACKQKQEYINDPSVYTAYRIIEHGLIKTLEELGWD